VGRHVIVALAGAVTCFALSAGPAYGAVAHTVQPGETLWSIAAASNFTTRALAAANGLPETAQVVAGQTIQIPSEYEAATALSGGPQAGGAAPPGPASASSSPGPIGAYTVRPGDTLTSIAARSGVSVQRLAWMNGLDPEATLVSGTALKLPTGAPNATAATTPARVAPAAEPQPTHEYVTPGQVGQIAAAHGVSPSLAAAIAKQESGYYNGWVSSANARGVMQILPGTWDFIEGGIAGRDIDPASAQENVHAGVMYLGRLLQDTGGDEQAAAASYYQGLSSVRRIGFLPETQRYVDSVMGLRGSLGG
jgi:N-acetylmuramoyl-L-alanine amidase